LFSHNSIIPPEAGYFFYNSNGIKYDKAAETSLCRFVIFVFQSLIFSIFALPVILKTWSRVWRQEA